MANECATTARKKPPNGPKPILPRSASSANLLYDWRAEFLQIVRNESERLSRLINQVLDLSRIVSGAAECHPVEVNMRQLVQEAVHSLQQLFHEQDVALTVNLPTEVPLIYIDPDRIIFLAHGGPTGCVDRPTDP